MKVKRRIIGVALGLLLPTALLWSWLIASSASTPLEPFLELPRSVGTWRATVEQQLEGEVWAMIRPDAYLFRRYESNARRPVWVYVGAYAGRAAYGKAAHDPKVCYPAAGYEIVESRTHELTLAGPESLTARLLRVQRGLDEETVLYWFQPAARWPTNPLVEELLQVFDVVLGRPQYAFVRLSAPTDGRSPVERDLEEFARAIAPRLRAAVGGFTRDASSPVAATSGREESL